MYIRKSWAHSRTQPELDAVGPSGVRKLNRKAKLHI